MVDFLLFSIYFINRDLGGFSNYWPVRLAVRTSDFQSGNTGSTPVRATSGR